MTDTVRQPNAGQTGRDSGANRAGNGNSVDANGDLLDTALARVARLEAVLAITGGSVHDVNNLLTILAGDLYLLTESVRQDIAMFEKVRSIRNTVERASTLMRELLTFSRDPVDEPPSICPANHVLALEPLLRRSLSKGQRLSVGHSETPWSVAASAAQFESAVTNLVLNARDAVGPSGAVEVRVENQLGDDNVAGGRLSRGDYICISVIDNGVGIPEQLLSRVTEPLVTSKAAGHGSGLGLSMVQRFAENAGGTMTIASTVGVGTTVRFWLPRNLAPAEMTANMTLPLSTLSGGDETVLLALHDLEVRTAVQQILEAVGYRVIVHDGPATVAAMEEDNVQPMIVLCTRSIEQAEQERAWLDTLRLRHGSLRHLAILSAGTDATAAAADADAFLYRPIGVLDLTRAMRSALEH